MTRQISCPAPECTGMLTRMDTRKTTMPKILRVRLYLCPNGHQVETAETVIGQITQKRRKKYIINTHTVRREEYRCRSEESDYRR